MIYLQFLLFLTEGSVVSFVFFSEYFLRKEILYSKSSQKKKISCKVLYHHLSESWPLNGM